MLSRRRTDIALFATIPLIYTFVIPNKKQLNSIFFKFVTNSSRLSICLSFNNKFTFTLITAVSKNHLSVLVLYNEVILSMSLLGTT